MKKYRIIIIVLAALLLISFGVNIFQYEKGKPELSWLQSADFVEDTVRGVLANEEYFWVGTDPKIAYDLDNEEYELLKEKYGIEEIAGDGGEFEKAKNLMHEFSGRIRHDSTDPVEPENMNAEYLLEKYLDNKKEGTYCRSKAQILNEMCLALGIYARKVWILPLSKNDDECHVINEVWDTGLNKWVMLDFTNDLYWVDGDGTPLSMLEVRDRIIAGEFCTPVLSTDDLSDLERSYIVNKYYYVYYIKNLAVLKYMWHYTVGETRGYYLLPTNYKKTEDMYLISREAVEAPPYEVKVPE